jgi:hypothetical protein
MNEQNEGDQGQMSAEDMTPEQFMAAIFANMVIQNTNMALMFLGKVPHPQTGQPMKDLESAQMFIDQIEMLAYKTRGNLNAEEKQLLQQSLISLRMTFVEELRKAGIPVPEHLTQGAAPLGETQKSESIPAAPTPAPAPTPAAPSQAAPSPSTAPAPEPAKPSAAEEESRKRFSKKY